MKRLLAWTMGATLLSAGPAIAASCSAQSPSHTVALLELYTSEGCSSCPPADRWLGSLRASGFGPDAVVPLALHVDYWNYLGWADPFSQAAFSERQKQVARWNQLRTIYTPQVTLQGKDFRYWGGGAFNDAVYTINQQPARANLALDLRLEPGQAVLRLNGQVRDRSVLPGAQVYLALYENGLTTQVPAGENAGRTLHHDHVVRALLGPFPPGSDGRIELQQTIALDPGWNPAQLGSAAFIQDARSGNVLQALELSCRN